MEQSEKREVDFQKGHGGVNDASFLSSSPDKEPPPAVDTTPLAGLSFTTKGRCTMTLQWQDYIEGNTSPACNDFAREGG